MVTKTAPVAKTLTLTEEQARKELAQRKDAFESAKQDVIRLEQQLQAFNIRLNEWTTRRSTLERAIFAAKEKVTRETSNLSRNRSRGNEKFYQVNLEKSQNELAKCEKALAEFDTAEPKPDGSAVNRDLKSARKHLTLTQDFYIGADESYRQTYEATAKAAVKAAEKQLAEIQEFCSAQFEVVRNLRSEIVSEQETLHDLRSQRQEILDTARASFTAFPELLHKLDPFDGQQDTIRDLLQAQSALLDVLERDGRAIWRWGDEHVPEWWTLNQILLLDGPQLGALCTHDALLKDKQDLIKRLLGGA
jgi:chromosome segregation ATPase